MKYILIILTLCTTCFAQVESDPLRYNYEINTIADSVTVVTFTHAALVTRIMVKIDTTITDTDSLRIGIGGGLRTSWHEEFGKIACAEYVPGTLVLLIEVGTVLYAGESISLYRGTTVGTAAGYFAIIPEYIVYP